MYDLIRSKKIRFGHHYWDIPGFGGTTRCTRVHIVNFTVTVPGFAFQLNRMSGMKRRYGQHEADWVCCKQGYNPWTYDCRSRKNADFV